MNLCLRASSIFAASALCRDAYSTRSSSLFFLPHDSRTSRPSMRSSSVIT